jgi:hypothetical protein
MNVVCVCTCIGLDSMTVWSGRSISSKIVYSCVCMYVCMYVCMNVMYVRTCGGLTYNWDHWDEWQCGLNQPNYMGWYMGWSLSGSVVWISPIVWDDHWDEWQCGLNQPTQLYGMIIGMSGSVVWISVRSPVWYLPWPKIYCPMLHLRPWCPCISSAATAWIRPVMCMHACM